MENQEFDKLLSTAAEMAGRFPEGLIYIGGIAVYLHAVNCQETAPMAEATHDADFYLSTSDLAVLRGTEELVPNRRQTKLQISKDGIYLDVYVERQSSLIVPYDLVAAHSVDHGGIRVAGFEELLALKLEAYRDRKGSAKGAKDARDLFRIAAIVELSGADFDANRCASYLTDQHQQLLADVVRSPVAMEMASGNAVAAKRLRSSMQNLVQRIDAAGEDPKDRATNMRSQRPRG